MASPLPDKSLISFARVFAHAPDAQLLLDTKGIIVASNLAADSLLGAVGHALAGRSLHEVLPVDSAPGSPVLPDSPPGDCWSQVFEVKLHRDGAGVVALHAHVNSVSDALPEGGYLLTLRRPESIEQGVSQSMPGANADQLRIFIQHAPAAVAMLDHEMRYIVYSTRWLSDYGLGDQDLTGRSHYEIFPEIPQVWRDIHQRCLAGVSERSEGDRFERTDGSVQYVRWEVLPWYLPDGVVGGLLFFTESITEQVEAQLALQESEGRFRALIQDLEVGVVLQDADDRILVSNAAARSMLGLEHESLEGVTSQDPRWQLIRPDGSPLPHEEVPSVLACRSLLPVRAAVVGALRIDTQERKWLRVSASPRMGADGSLLHVLVTLVDVTNEVNSQSALKAREAAEREINTRFAIAAESANMGVWELDLQSNQLIWDEGSYRVFGIERGPADSPLELWSSHVHPDDLQQAIEVLLENVNTSDTLNLEYRIIRPSGEVRNIKSHARVQRDGQGQPFRLVGVNIDITQQRQLEEQLLHSQKMQAVGSLAGGIAHEFNNLLTVITGYADMLAGELANGPKGASSRLQHILDASERASRLTQQLLLFSRRAVLQPAVFDLNEVAERLLSLLTRLMEAHITIECIKAEEPVRIRADRTQIEQLLLNLCLNARDAMPKGGTLSIACKRVDLDEQARLLHPECQTGPYVLLSVSDTGLGISAEVQSRMFEPFFTTKRLGESTGLGLATVFAIVQQCAGFIEVHSEEDNGTRFDVYLPECNTADEKVATPRQKAELAGRGRVLLVEDEPQVREVLTLALQAFGYEVVAAENGIAAMDRCKEAIHPFDLLVTDVVMPEMGGGQLARLLCYKYPDLKVIFMSGYSYDSLLELGLDEEDVTFLQKPFTPQVLAARVRELLGTK